MLSSFSMAESVPILQERRPPGLLAGHCADRAARAAQTTPFQGDALCTGRWRTGSVHQAAVMPPRCRRTGLARLHCLETSRHVSCDARHR